MRGARRESLGSSSVGLGMFLGEWGERGRGGWRLGEWGDQSGEKGVGGCGTGDHGTGGRLLSEIDLRKMDCRCVGSDRERCLRRSKTRAKAVTMNRGM